jgi:hypothetical protein
MAATDNQQEKETKKQKKNKTKKMKTKGEKRSVERASAVLDHFTLNLHCMYIIVNITYLIP